MQSCKYEIANSLRNVTDSCPETSRRPEHLREILLPLGVEACLIHGELLSIIAQGDGIRLMRHSDTFWGRRFVPEWASLKVCGPRYEPDHITGQRPSGSGQGRGNIEGTSGSSQPGSQPD